MSEQKDPAPALEFPVEELMAIVEQARTGAISADQYTKLKAVIQTFALLKDELRSKKTSIQRLKRMLFGSSTEKTREVLGDAATDQEAAATGQSGEDRADGDVKRKGHGRNAAGSYIGAEKVIIPHPSLHAGDLCPSCVIGKVYPVKDPGVRVRFSGVAPLQAKVFECARLRCGLCGEVHAASAP